MSNSIYPPLKNFIKNSYSCLCHEIFINIFVCSTNQSYKTKENKVILMISFFSRRKNNSHLCKIFAIFSTRITVRKKKGNITRRITCYFGPGQLSSSNIIIYMFVKVKINYPFAPNLFLVVSESLNDDCMGRAKIDMAIFSASFIILMKVSSEILTSTSELF